MKFLINIMETPQLSLVSKNIEAQVFRCFLLRFFWIAWCEFCCAQLHPRGGGGWKWFGRNSFFQASGAFGVRVLEPGAQALLAMHHTPQPQGSGLGISGCLPGWAFIPPGVDFFVLSRIFRFTAAYLPLVSLFEVVLVVPFYPPQTRVWFFF